MTQTIAISVSSFAEADQTPLKILSDAGVIIKPNPLSRRLNEEEIIDHLKGVDGLIAGLEPLNRRVLSSAPNLKAISRVGIGMDNVDLAAARDLDIKVSNTPDPPTDAVAEMTVAAMLALARRIVPSDRAIHAGRWEKIMGIGLSGCRVLIVGFGRIGRRVSDILKSLKTEIAVCDPNLTAADIPETCSFKELHEGLQWADIVTLHASGKSQILGSGELGLMKTGALLLNSARGELVDEASLIDALTKGNLGGVWFDAFWKEPYSGKLSESSLALLTPHVSTYTDSCRRGMETEAVLNLLKDLK